MRVLSRVLSVGLLFALYGCHSPANPQEVTPALQALVAGSALPKVEAANWTDLRAFYTQRENAPAWVNHRRPTDKAAAALKVLNTARQHGYDPEDYGAAALLASSQQVEDIDKKSPKRLEELAEFDARLTAGLLAFGRDIAVGRSNGDAHFKSRRQAPDLVAALSANIDDPEKFVDADVSFVCLAK